MTPPPALLNFLAGIFAAAGVNLLTGAVESSSMDLNIRNVVFACLPWFGSAISLAVTATIIDRAHADANPLITPNLTAAEKRAVLGSAVERVRGRLIALGAATLILVSLGTLATLHAIPPR